MGVSVIIPTIGRATLADAVRSVCDQGDRPQDELILVCDGQMNTPGLWRGFEAADHRRIDVKVVILDNQHADYGSAARNAGLAAATKRWVCYLDDDDLMMLGALDAIWENSVRVGQHPELHLYREIHPAAPNGIVWGDKVFEMGNVGTGCIVHSMPWDGPAPYEWPTGMYQNDYAFAESLINDHAATLYWHDVLLTRVCHWL